MANKHGSLKELFTAIADAIRAKTGSTEKIVAEQKLTTMMVTHSMKQALEVGDRTVMLHQGKVVLDVCGEERKNLSVKDLLLMFEKVRGEEIDDDALILA